MNTLPTLVEVHWEGAHSVSARCAGRYFLGRQSHDSDELRATRGLAPGLGGEANMEVRAFAECPGVAGGYLSSGKELANCYDRAFGECPEYPTASGKGS